MPKLYDYLGFIFYFYSHEHLPIHIHVKKGNRESKCEIYYDKEVYLKWKKVTDKKTLTASEIKDADLFIHKYYSAIINKWTQYFLFHQNIVFEKIQKL